MSITSIRALRILMPISAICSLIAQMISLVTNDWLYTIELMPNLEYVKFQMPPEMEFNRKSTISGLWILCYNEPPDLTMKCMEIDYFSKEEYIADQNDSTMAIPYTAKRAAIYFLISTISLIIGHMLYFLSKCCGYRRIITFISGIPFILAGLFILAGIVVYISTFKGEVGHKLRSTSEFQDPMFSYRYGYSFLMLVASLIFSELTGTFSIFLYISQENFKIKIDTERDAILKKNILNILMADYSGKSGSSDHRSNSGPSEQPVLRIICDDEDNKDDPPCQSPNVEQLSPANPNFLSPEFGLDPALYYCGRHGSRGRRNSRSTESFIGSPSEPVRRLSFSCGTEEIISTTDDTDKRPQRSCLIEAERKSSIMKESENSGKLHELSVPQLLQTPARQDYAKASSNSKAKYKKECYSIKTEQLAMPYAISMSIQQMHLKPLDRKDMDTTTAPNRSTLV